MDIKTKTYLRIALTALCATSACGCDKAPVSAEKNLELLFCPPVVRPQTKAYPGEVGPSYQITGSDGKVFYEDFAVWSLFSDTKITNVKSGSAIFFEGIKAFHTGSSLTSNDYWRLADTYYWPHAGYLSFHALSPYSATEDGAISNFFHSWGQGSDGSGFGFDFAMQDNLADQYDLLYSDYTFAKTRSDYTFGTPYDDVEGDKGTYNGVDIQFRHALSSVHVLVKTDIDYPSFGGGVRLILKGLDVSNYFTQGTFREGRNGTNNTSASWSSQKAPKDKSAIFSGRCDISTNATDVGSFLVIPQSVKEVSGRDDPITLRLTYSLKIGSVESEDVTSSIPLDFSGGQANWAIGKRYNYTIVFKMDSIHMDPILDTFVEITDISL